MENMNAGMNFDWGNMNEITIGVSPNSSGSLLNIDNSSEKQQLDEESRVVLQEMIKANKQNNYFTSMLNKFPNGDFIYYLKPEHIQKSAKERIFKEIIQGKIDYSIFGQYFIDSKFLENLLIASKDELNNNTLIRDALMLYDNTYPGNSFVMATRSRYESLAYIYSVLTDKFNIIKATGNVGILADTQYVLGAYRNVLQ